MTKRISKIFIAFMLLLSVFFVGSHSKFLANTPKELNQVTFGDFIITDSLNNSPAWYNSGHNLKVGLSWDASMYNDTLNGGDYFTFNFNDNFDFTRLYPNQLNFELKDENEVVIANVALTPNGTNGGTAKITLTDAVKGRFNVKGRVFFIVGINKGKIGRNDGLYDFTLTANGSQFTKQLEVKYVGPKPITSELVKKAANGRLSEGQIEWVIYINPKKDLDLRNVVIKDSLRETDHENGNAVLNRITYVDGTFNLYEYEMDEFGGQVPGTQSTKLEIGDKLVISSDKRSFTFNMGDASGKQYKLVYRSTYYEGYTSGNTAVLTADGGKTQTSSSGYAKSFSGGDAQSQVKGKIKIVKVDASNSVKKLKDATFEVKKTDGTGQTYTITTDTKGEALTPALPLGEYTVKETVAPKGYVLDTTPKTATVDPNAGVTLTFTNEQEKTTFDLTKIWANYPANATVPNAKFQLKADGNNHGTVVTLTGDTATPITGADNVSNTYQWTNLPKYRDDNTTLVQYTVEEIDVPSGFTVAYNVTPATETVAGRVEVTNTYKATATSLALEVNKVLTGRTLNENEFTFELKENGNVVKEATNNANGVVRFEAIEYTEAGVHNYTITEKVGNAKGVSYSDKEIAVTVTVTDNNQGALSATATYPQDKTITNTYTAKAAPVVLSFTKALTGRTLKADEFEFELFDTAGTSYGKVRNKADGSIQFNIAYTRTGTYDYIVKEVKGNDAGITYSTEELTAKVVVTDNNQGQLVAVVTYGDDTEFNNSYKGVAVDTTLNFTKALTGRTLSANEFSFELYNEQDVLEATVQNGPNGEITFPLTFDTVGTYRYTVKEKNGTLPGVTYDANVANVTVTVTDNLQGQLVADVVTDKTTFNNTYKPASVDTTLSFTKALTGRTLKADEFTFELFDETGSLVKSATNVEDGTITFPLTFDAAGTYRYTVKEKNGTLPGVTYDVNVANVTVTVTDDNQGQLVADVVTDKTTFNNTYKPASVDTTLNFTKALTGRTLKADEFTFELFDAQNQVVGKAKNTATGDVVFNLTFGEVGTYKFTAKEVKGTEVGMIYSKEVFEVTVDVTDDLNGQLVAKVTYPEDVTFNNVFIEEPVNPDQNTNPTPKKPNVDTSDVTTSYAFLLFASLVGLFVVKKLRKN